MNPQPVGHKVKAFGARKLAFLFLIIALLIPACARQPQPARVEEITFQSGEFTLVGDLRTPAGTGPFPVVLFVHGDGVANRVLFGAYVPLMERMLRAGYAVFSWDKPGNGESTGQLREPYLRHQRAQIVLDAIEVMKAHRDIDPQRIGLWGISQGGWVMPRVLMASDDVAFMICVSCGGVSGHDWASGDAVFRCNAGGRGEGGAALVFLRMAGLSGVPGRGGGRARRSGRLARSGGGCRTVTGD